MSSAHWGDPKVMMLICLPRLKFGLPCCCCYVTTSTPSQPHHKSWLSGSGWRTKISSNQQHACLLASWPWHLQQGQVGDQPNATTWCCGRVGEKCMNRFLWHQRRSSDNSLFFFLINPTRLQSKMSSLNNRRLGLLGFDQLFHGA